ncbi:MAG: nitrilase-related carbon-nitrogen hydrolase [Sphingobacteriia bacterium]|jgi:apolipoprotein N-acyltransferase
MKKKWLLLIPGLVLLYFSNGRFAIPIAGWLFPLCFFPISRDKSIKFTGILFPILVAITLQASFWKFTSNNIYNLYFYIPFFAGLIYGSIFYFDRLFYLKRPNFIATLFFPLMYTSIDFINSLVNPFGTTGVLGYAQLGFLPIAQLASITGMWGITFIITWFGSIAHWGLTEPFSITKKGLVSYTVILSAILIFGIIRLLIPTTSEKLKVAGIHTSDKERDGKAFWKALAQKDTSTFLQNSKLQIEALIISTKKEVNNGAKMVLWSEVSPTILKAQEEHLKQILSSLALSKSIYLIANPYIATIDGSKPENVAWIFSPEGKLVFSHFKYGGNFLEGSVEGNKKLQVIQTSHGKMSSIICWDADFPSIVKQLGRLDVDVVFNPASDWQEIDPIHTRVAIFRAIENGCAWVRQTRNGLSIITDQKGRTISKMDHFETNHWVNSGMVPFKKSCTIYPVIGDFFGWTAMLSLIVLIVYRLKKSSTYEN